MQRNNTPVLLAAIVLGLLAIGATVWMLRGPSTPAPAPVAAVPTPTPAPRLVAARYIPPRTVITPAMLRQDFTTSGAAPTDALKSVDDVVGQLTNEPIGAGETVRTSSFTPRIRRDVDANIPIPSGLRGVAIWVDPKQTAAGLVDVGDRVDVIATHKLSYEKGPRQYVIGAASFTEARTIAQNLLVLGVDKSIEAPTPTPTPVPGAPAAPPAAAPPPAAPPPPPPPPGAPTPRTRIMLAATPDVAARLVSANDQGTLHITIRNPIDADAGVVPAAREYPSRVATSPREPTATASGGNTGGGNTGGGNTGGGRDTNRTRPSALEVPRSFPRERIIQQTTPPIIMAPNPNNQVPATGPLGGTGMGGSFRSDPPSKEITVIRGTEKTRVLVPQR
ncbi:MAG: Flp pilus assembly protein CpaB [Armatimonadetes bacterium]|nr:Flp pilus assembly protein CpaB [Armatimonadota bacterium]